MIRNLKALGLALIAVFAIGAVMVASASATLGHLTSTRTGVETFGTGSDTGAEDALHKFGSTLTCTHDTFIFGKYNSTKEPGVHNPLILPASTVTVTPFYTGCSSGSEPATVTMNGCDFVFHLTDGKVDLICPVGKVVEIHRYSNAHNHATGISNCTTTIKPKTGMGTLTYKNLAGGDVEVNGTITGLTVESHGACSFGFTIENSEGTYTLLEDIVEGEDTAGNPVSVHVG